jgi:tRNA pseudouridine55 synthase
MARRRKGQPVSGWILLDKPAGMTSTRAVTAVRRAFDAQKAGHAGTLDPMATGVLPIALGEATKTVPHVMDAAKQYRFTVRWGIATATDDAEGAVLATSDRRPDRAAIEAALPAFFGRIEQIPPAFSAIKVAGERAYDLARAGEAVDLAPRTVVVHRLAILEAKDPDRTVFAMDCGKGTYVRSLARDLARTLGTLGHVAELRRISVGSFAETGAISLESLLALGHSAAASGHLLPVETALADIPALALTEEEARRLRLGQPVAVLPVARRTSLQDVPKDSVLCAMTAGKLVAMARIQGGEIRPVRVLNI